MPGARVPQQAPVSNRSARRAALGVAAVVLAAQLATASFRIDTIDTGVRLEVARSLVRDGTAAVAPMRMPTPFGIVGSFPGADGRHYSVYGLGQSLLFAPLVAAGGAADRFLVTLVNPLLAAATCGLLVLVAASLGFPLGAAAAAALLTGLGTLLWPQGKLTFEAPIEAFCLLAAFAGLSRGGRGPAALAGLAFALALATRPTAVLLLPGAAILLAGGADRAGRTAAFALGTLPGALLFLGYNAYRWGSPLATGYPATGFRYFAPSVKPLWGLVASPGRGFFVYSPVLALAPLGYRELARRAPALARAIVATAAVFLAFFSATTVWHGDWTWGPRHLLPLVPLAGLLLVPVLAGRRVPRALLAPLAAVSVLVQLVGATVSYEAYYLWHNDRMRRTGVRERAGEYHFSIATSQLRVQLGQAALFFSRMPERSRAFDPSREPGPWQPILQGSPPVVKRLPDVWWVWLPLAGAPPLATAGIGMVVAGLAGAGAVLIRRAGARPPGTAPR